MQLSFITGLVVAIHLHMANAQSPLTCDSYSVWIEKQADLNSISSCTRLTGGSLVIADGWDGSFEFSGLSSISGNVVAGNPTESSATTGSPKVTSLGLPDLVTLDGGIVLAGVPSLSSVSVPKLQSVGESIMISGISAKTLAFPALKSLTGRSFFYGDFNEISFPALKNANYISISSKGNLDCAALGQRLVADVTWDLCASEAGCSENGFQCESASGKWEHTTSPEVFTQVLGGTTAFVTCTSSVGHTCTKGAPASASAAATTTKAGVSTTRDSSAPTSTKSASGTASSGQASSESSIEDSATPALTSSGAAPTSSSSRSATTSEEAGTSSIPDGPDGVMISAGSITGPAVAFAFMGMTILAFI